LAQNLITDERRTILRQAKIFRNAGDFERISMLNELYLDAAKAYWNWVNAFYEVEIFEEYIRLAQVRFDAIKRSYEKGANPAIDTLEALILLQSRQVGYNDAMIELNRTANALSNFLWTADESPLVINDLSKLIPQPMDDLNFKPILTADSLTSAIAALNKHPDIRLKELKVNWLEAEQRLKFNKILPKINLNYNFLTEPVGGITNWNFGGFQNNFKYGINFKMPVFLREEIGNYKMAKVKVKSADYDVNIKRLELQNKLKTSFSDYFYFGSQINTYNYIVANYQKLTEAEVRKFDIGESSIFLINSREQKLIESRLKLIELQSKFYKALAGFYFARGDLYLLW
jgi:outer membrane protein TolC